MPETAAPSALLAEDEPLLADELEEMLRTLWPQLRVVARAGDGAEALAAVNAQMPDLAFLDIHMPRLSGIDVARQIAGRCHIAFITAFDQYAIDAFEVNAVDYVLKPVEQARLAIAVDRARKRVAAVARAPEARPESRTDPDLERLLQMLADRQGRREQLAIKVEERFLLVQADEVVHASVEDDQIRVVTNSLSGTSNYRTLDELQTRLDPAVFWRVHRSHLVNINKIKEIVPWFSRNYILKMRDAKGSEIPVSRSQTRRLREYLKL